MITASKILKSRYTNWMLKQSSFHILEACISFKIKPIKGHIENDPRYAYMINIANQLVKQNKLRSIKLNEYQTIGI